MATPNNNKILIGIDDCVVELTGDELRAFQADQLLRQEAIKNQTDGILAKKQALMEKLGISVEEATLLGL